MKINLAADAFRSKISFNYLWENSFIGWSIKAIFIISGLEFLTLIIFWKFIPPQIPLFYSRPWGQEQLVEKITIFLVPLFCLFSCAVNLILGNSFLKSEKFLSKIFIFTNLLINFLLLVAFLEVLFLVVF